MAPPAGNGPPSTGPPDRRTLQVLERQLEAEPLVAETTFEPTSDEPRVLQAQVDDEQFPPSVASVRLDCRWFVTNDFSVHYVETTVNEDHWECRWDRHPNAHDPRCHFHLPPAGTETTDLELPSLHPLDVLSTVVAAVEQRVEQRWADADS
ncbi:hypothetical protein D8Y22_18385 [Salinadaptatus halalkaliphilus]|uniref:Uncharacterized protein n=1 Tax=Salinadaptatus halalkaliphilus TaxID=2419781 RepID=A0A4S3THM4_9EURY|nr:hypothetical protein [Salinadaptatus halalkaliphilus]THE63416.1 hypothetical protein D8Y22_18385 [Salinadaptatus halalkaliphilus]